MVRGQPVSCTAHLEPQAPFVVLERLAMAEGHELRDASEQHAEQSFSWSGPAAVSTEVGIKVRAGEHVLLARSLFLVKARSFPRLELPAELPAWEYGEDALFGGWPPPLRSVADNLVADGSLGQFSLVLQAAHTQYVEDGPNARWFYVAEPIAPPRVQVRLHRALGPEDPFYKLQKGGSSGACLPGDVDDLRNAVLRHEGAAPGETPSHYAESRKALQLRDLQAELEELHLFYDDAMSKEALHDILHKKLQAFLNQLHEDQRQSVDAAAPVRMRCRLRYP